MPLNVSVSERANTLTVDVNNVVQLEVQPLNQEVDVEVEHVVFCSYSFVCIAKAVSVIISGTVSILSIIGSFLTGRF